MSDVVTQEPGSQPNSGATDKAVRMRSRVTMNERTKTKLISDLNKNFQQCASQRLPFEREWYYNMAFYFGRQWVEWVGAGTSTSIDYYRLYEPPAPRWRVRLTVNKIKSIIRNELTKLTKEQIQYFVAPESTDEQDLAAARAAESISEYLFRDLRYNYVRRRATFWALMCGTSFLKNWYVPQKLDSIGNLGAICCEPITAFHMFVPHIQEEDLEAQPFLYHASAKDKQWVEDTYGEIAANGTEVGVYGSNLEQKFFSALGLQQQSPRNYVYVKEAWIKPCKAFRTGAMITFSGSEILSMTDWPFAFNDYPFAKIDHIPTGRFYSESVIKDLIPLQREINRTRSQLIESKNRMARPQLIAPKGSVDPQKITSEPGLIITYQPGFQPPVPIKLQDIPNYVINELDRDEKDLYDIGNYSEISQGRTPPNVEAASAISFLEESNNTKFAHTISSIEEATEKCGKQWLVLANQFWDNEHKIKVAGSNRTFETMVFTRADINGATDFRIEAQSSMPRSRAAKQAFLTEIGKLGWLPPDKVLKYLEMMDTDRLYEETQISQRQAQRENLKMKLTGQMLPANDFDEDMIHVAEHENFCRTEEFEFLDPMIQQVILQHLTLHKQRVTMSQPMAGSPQMDQVAAQPGLQQELPGPQQTLPQPGPPPPQGL